MSSAKIGTGSWRYYTEGVACRASEYYLGVGEAPGRWHGRGLEQLGLLAGAVVAERELEALFARGLHPTTGSRLGRAWRIDGVTGFDLTFSAPKSVSALWALGDRGTAAEAMAAHRAAVRAGLTYLDTHAALSRRGTDGVEQIDSAGLVAAVFDHRSSRAGDPQLHTHALVLNKVRCEDGRWRALDATELFHHKKSAGMIYQAALRHEMHQRLGVTFREVNENGQADIAGVPDELLKLWSKRTAKIDAEAGPKIAEYEKLLGRTLSSSERVGVVKTAVLKTRAAKQHPALSALHTTWTAEAARVGWTPERLRQAVRLRVPRTRPAADAGVLPSEPADRPGLAGPSGPVPPVTDRSGPQHPEPVLPAVLPAEATVPAGVAAGVAAAALQGAGTRRAVFSRADVAGQVAALLPTTGLSASEVLSRVEQLTDVALGLDEAVPIGLQSGGVTLRASDARYATVQVLSTEARILDLAARGRRGGYGRVRHSALMPIGRDGRLDPSQYRALLQLAAGGDFLSVLTAPAGAGKTSTLGAAARAWQDAGYRVIGLAPSARAAAELATATGGPTDTLAKWLHTHHGNPAGAQEAAALDDRTVVIVDEASMASTLDLDPLITAAARVGAKVVLVGDPAQIGVVNGPGGMLAALARAGHGVELAEIHRFSQPWERQASLALRRGTPGALAAYRLAGRLHPCQDGDAALDGVFAHWAAARAQGQDALMLARTRVDVDALNLRARAAALAAGKITGPVTVAGGRDWQAGDVLRARRNDRRLTVGDGHVRNGDRYEVLGPGPQDGLIVQDLTGRGRIVLPAAYLAEHAEYGWASTIDAAQGATADTGIVLVRPGMDREHLYVAMTRGRHGNHAYITPDPNSTDDDHNHGHGHQRPPSGVDDPQEQAVRVLEAALGRSGAQDAAHTALDRARTQAAHTDRQNQRAAEQAAERAAVREAAAAQQQRRQTRPLLPEHARAVQQLNERRAQRERLRTDRDALHRGLHQSRQELEAVPRWARGCRRALTDTILSSEQELRRSEPTLASLDAEMDRLTRQVAQHTRQRLTSDAAGPHRPRPGRWDQG
ncbi:MAG: relaxase domain-containing protein, partial [Actinomycetota bacterium]|nr:relaxase domain-containing protein [Actinomycetota bacterium]